MVVVEATFEAYVREDVCLVMNLAQVRVFVAFLCEVVGLVREVVACFEVFGGSRLDRGLSEGFSSQFPCGFYLVVVRG